MISLNDMLRVFGRIGVLSFGGPAAQITLMHQELVTRRAWLDEAQFLRALSFCMLLPGPEAMQLATYAGWKQRGIIGGLIAGGLFVLPGAAVIMVLALLYGSYGNLALVQAVFLGVKATVVVIVIEALIRVMRRALHGRLHVIIAVSAFFLLYIINAPFPVVILLAAIAGAIFGAKSDEEATTASHHNWRSTVMIIVIGSMLWWAPVVLAHATGAAFLTELGIFFSKLAVVTFGGAYSVLAYMTQAVVGDFGWLSTPQMMDALGLAETTPGPLILVTQFVAMIAGIAKGGVDLALLAGAMTLWVTFVPCFIWIFAGAPMIDWLAGQPHLRNALAGITAAVVGVIANLSLWFALHVFFADVQRYQLGLVDTMLPVTATVQWVAVVLGVIAGFFLLRRHWGLAGTLACVAGLALAAHFLFPAI